MRKRHRRKGKWKRGMVVGKDCNSQPIRVGDTVLLNVQCVRYGEWHEENWECEVMGKPEGEPPILRRLLDDWIVNLDFDPESDIEVSK